MILTFDSGILVRATDRSNGPARQALRTVASSSEHSLALSHYIISEVGKVLAYERLQREFPLSGNEIHEYTDLLYALCDLVVEPLLGRPVVLHDPKDDEVIYTAVAARADILCTRDKHFRDPYVRKFCLERGISVMNEIDLPRALR